MGCGDEKLSKYLTQTFTAHCNAMICQQVTLSGDGSCTCILRVIPNARESGTIPPLSTCVRGHCHDIQPRFLPARAHRPGVVVPDTLWPLAIGACGSSPNDAQAAAAPMQALPKAQALSRSHPSTLLCCL